MNRKNKSHTTGYQLTISLVATAGQDGELCVGIYDPSKKRYLSCTCCSDGTCCCPATPVCCLNKPIKPVKKLYVTFSVISDDHGVLIEKLDSSCGNEKQPLPRALPGHLEIVPLLSQ